MLNINIRKMKASDIRMLDKIYEKSSEQTKAYFHPGIFKEELRHLENKLLFFAARLSLILSTYDFIRVVLIPIFTWIPLVATLNHQIVGLTFLKINRGKTTLGIFVSDKYQGLGIGKKLMQAIILEARRNNLKRIHLNVLVSNRRARKLYESFNFRYTGKKIYVNGKKKSSLSLEMVLDLSKWQ